MKIMKYSILLLLFFVNIFYSQKIDVTYNVVSHPNSNDLTYTEEDNFLLKIRDNESIYYSIKYYFIISNQQKAMEMGLNPNKISNNYSIVKKDDKIYHIRPIGEDYMQYEEKELPKWKIENEYKKIDSLNVRKASTNYRGRQYIAWYTDEINISDGPYKFKNLPGLILEMESVDGDYIITLNGIEKKEDKIETPKTIMLKDRKKYKIELKKFADNPSYKMMMRDNSNTFKYKTYVGGKEVNNTEKYKLFNEFVWNFMKTHNNSLEKDEIWIR